MRPVVTLLIIVSLWLCPLRCALPHFAGSMMKCADSHRCCSSCDDQDKQSESPTAPTPCDDCACQSCVCKGGLLEKPNSIDMELVCSYWIVPADLTQLDGSLSLAKSHSRTGDFIAKWFLRDLRIELGSLLI